MTIRSPGRGRSVTLAAAVIVLATFVVPAGVSAHAELDTVTPADGSTVDVAPTEIVMTFTQNLDSSKSSIVLVTAAGAQVTSGGEVVGTDPRRMTLAVPALEPGTYEIRWTSWSAEDNEGDRGITSFTVAPPPPTPSPTPSPTNAAIATPAQTLGPSSTPVASPSGSGTPTSGTADVLIPIIAAVILVAGLGYWLMRRRTGAGGTP